MQGLQDLGLAERTAIFLVLMAEILQIFNYQKCDRILF
jgi:hypothetical protein